MAAPDQQSKPQTPCKRRWPDFATFPDPATSDGAHVKSLVSSLWKSRESDGDFILQCKGETIRAHRCVLAAASPVFKAMLATDMVEGLTSSVDIDALPEDALAMLRFAYMGSLENLAPLSLPGVLALAHKYEVTSLIPVCCDAMIVHLNAETAVPFVRVLRLLEGEPMDLPKAAPVPDPPSPMSRYVQSSTLAGGLFVGDWPPEHGSDGGLFGSAGRLPQGPVGEGGVFGLPQVRSERYSLTGGLNLSAGNNSSGTLLGSPGTAGGLSHELGNDRPATRPACGDGDPPQTPEEFEAFEDVSPIARAFVAVAQLIAADPELQMIALRGI